MSDKGGNETDYINILSENGKREFVAARGKGHFIYLRHRQDAKGVLGSWIALDKDGKLSKDNEPLSGFGLENCSTLVPQGPYGLILSRERRGANPSSLQYPNCYVLFNDAMGVGQGRGITIHNGNFYDKSTGCILPGAGFGIGKRGEVNDLKEPDSVLSRLGFLRTFNSSPKRKKMEEFIRGGTNVSAEEARARAGQLQFHIVDAVPQDD